MDQNGSLQFWILDYFCFRWCLIHFPFWEIHYDGGICVILFGAHLANSSLKQLGLHSPYRRGILTQWPANLWGGSDSQQVLPCDLLVWGQFILHLEVHNLQKCNLYPFTIILILDENKWLMVHQWITNRYAISPWITNSYPQIYWFITAVPFGHDTFVWFPSTQATSYVPQHRGSAAESMDLGSFGQSDEHG